MLACIQWRYVKLNTWLSIKSSGAAVPRSVVAIHRPQAEGFSPCSFWGPRFCFYTQNIKKKAKQLFLIFFPRRPCGMPLFKEDPAHLSKSRLKSDLVAHNVALPPAKSRKEVYVELHLKHVDQKNAADFSSDEEDQGADVAVSLIELLGVLPSQYLHNWHIACNQNLTKGFSFSSCLACLRKNTHYAMSHLNICWGLVNNAAFTDINHYNW